ncbi:MAG: M50 family metallopeptidase [Mariniblastus sp.]
MRLKLGRIVNIDVFLHWTFILAPIYLVYEWRWQKNLPWSTVAILFGLLMAAFASVLMHEFGHALMARWFGVETKDIIITPIGGLARLEGMPKKAFEELLITVAGPLVNLVIASLIAVYLAISGSNWLPSDGFEGLTEIPVVLMWMNIALFLFNLVPAFPMDGGRILRSGLSMVLGHRTATLAAGSLGMVLAIGFAMTGLVIKQYPFMLIGGFVFLAALYEMRSPNNQVQPGDIPANHDLASDSQRLQ